MKPPVKQVALVTGAASGLGALICRALWQAGYCVALGDLSLEAARQAAQAVDPSGARTLALKLDVRQPDNFAEVIKRVTSHFGGLQVLVNNAALTLTTPVMEIDVDEFDRVIATNLRGTFLGCQLAGRCFAQQRYGRIINLASLAGQNGGTASGAHYAASKGGIITLTKVFARALSAEGVTVNAIAPGPLDLPSVHTLVTAEKLPALLDAIPVHQLGDPAFVAQMVLLLASPAAASVSGATWDVNGGLFMR